MIPTPPSLLADTPGSTCPEVNVLVVDDVQQNLVAMQALLERPGLRVLCARSGNEALEMLLTHDVALALLDVQMPGMDGFELAELMRGAARTHAVPIIFLTAAPIDGQRSFRGYEAGAVDFLNKPVDQRVLLSKVAVFAELFAQRQQLRSSLDESQRLLALNEAMVAVLTHDLRTPLQAMLASAELLQRKSPDALAQKTAGGIKASGLRMARMIAQLLDFSRIRSGTLQIDRRPADLGDTGAAVIAELQQATPSAAIELHTQGDLQGVFDADRLMQVLSNLISNAVQHGEPGRPIDVLLDGVQPAKLRGEVRNAGRLPAHVQERLFEPFRTAQAGTEGLGLGLYIVAQFVRAHGGEVRGRSEPHGSTVFEFELPRG
jgi:signal transduction histidine kinase